MHAERDSSSDVDVATEKERKGRKRETTDFSRESAACQTGGCVLLLLPAKHTHTQIIT